MAGRIGMAVATGALAALIACSPIIHNHGYVPSEAALSELQVGRDTRESVAAAVGEPTTAGILEDGAWYYVQSRFRASGIRPSEVIDREVVAVSFTDAGTLSNIERFGLEEGRVVPLSRRVTRENTQGVGFLRQLFRNIGNVNPADILGDDSGGL